jgi:hypothetical protein
LNPARRRPPDSCPVQGVDNKGGFKLPRNGATADEQAATATQPNATVGENSVPVGRSKIDAQAPASEPGGRADEGPDAPPLQSDWSHN